MREVESLAEQESLEDAVKLLTSNKARIIEDDYIIVKKWLLEKIIEEDSKSENPEIAGKVLGKNPDTGEKEISLLYSRVSEENKYNIFTNDMSERFGENIFGTKAVVYFDANSLTGKFAPKVIFLSESKNTHHSQALSELVDTDFKQLIYDGEFSNPKIKQFLPFSFGYEILYNSKTGQIVKIKMDSRITKAQETLETKISREIIEIANDVVIDNIEESLLIELFKKKGSVIEVPPELAIT